MRRPLHTVAAVLFGLLATPSPLWAASSYYGGRTGSAAVTPSGGSSPTPIPQILGRILTPYDFGGLGDTQRKNCTVTTVSGSPTVTITGCSFTAADIGKYIVIHNAGASLATSPIASDAVNAAGSAYTTIPTITVTDATGAGALLTANEGLDTATDVAGGSGCTNSLATFTVVGGTNTTAATFTATPSGGSLTGQPLTPVIAGSYSALPSVSAAAVTGGSCVGATISSTWHQVTPTVVFTGYNFTAPTAAYSAGNATLSNPVLAAPYAKPYASTISNVVGTTLTLAGNAGQTITATSEPVIWGHDDSAAINKLIVATSQNGVNSGPSSATGNYSICGMIPPALDGYWGAASGLTWNPGGVSSCLRGGGASSSQIVALASMASLISASNTFVWGSVIEDVGFDGNKLATNTGNFACAEFARINQAAFRNAASQNGATVTADMVLGDGVVTCNTAQLTNVEFSAEDILYGGGSGGNHGFGDAPSYGLVVKATDALITNPHGEAGAAIAEIYETSTASNTTLVNPHVWPNATVPTAGIILGGWGETFNPMIDGGQQQLIHITGSSNKVFGGHGSGANMALSVGVLVDSGVDHILVTGFDALELTNAANYVKVNGTIATNDYIWGNSGATDYNSLARSPNGDTSSLALGGALANTTLTSGGGNVGIGGNALSGEVTGASNTAVGQSAGFRATGNGGTYLGAYAGFNNSSGTQNTFIGNQSGQTGATPITGSNITTLGFGSGAKLAGAAATNTVIGANVASTTLTTGTFNLLLGCDSNTDAATGASAHTIHIGCGAGDVFLATGTGTPSTGTVTVAGTITLPNVTTGTNADFLCAAAGGVVTLQTSACTISSLRFKLGWGLYRDDPLATLARFDVGTFRMAHQENNPDHANASRLQIGLNAENVAKIEPRCAIYEPDGVTPKSYRQECLIGILVAGMQAQQREIDRLKARRH